MQLQSASGVFFRNQDDILNKEEVGKAEIGGMAMFPILLISLCLTMGISKWLSYYNIYEIELGITGERIMQVVAGCTLLFLVGLKNDIHGTFSKTKFLMLLLATSMFPLSGLWIRDLQGLFGIHELSAWVGVPLTILLSMYITESIVLLDDIDGLGMGMLSIMLGIFLGFSLVFGFTLGTLITSAGLGVSIPYSLMKFCRPTWRKTLVGNAGSYPMGYILCYATLSLIAPAGIKMPEGMLMIVLGITFVPLVDLLRSLRRRAKEGRSLQIPDRNQMQHRLIRMGIKPALTPVFILLTIGLFAALNTLWVVWAKNLTLLAIVDIAVWIGLQLSINYIIRRREEKQNQSAWTMAYGRDAWEADVPIEKIRRKREQFGTMGMQQQYIMGEETDFIPDGMNALERNTKRAIDLVIASILLVVTSPIMLICYLLIVLEDGHPAIYKQERIGRFGRPFMTYKFRTMHKDAEKNGPALSHKGGEDDERLTRVGRVLRAHHLDELPQLWNVFCGDMAFVGYRPERKYFIDQIMEHDPRYSMLYQIRPGVTSYATLYNGYTDTMEKMLRRLNYDLYYLENRSFWFDLKVIWSTFIRMVLGKRF